jgi:hypothetical protein
LVGFAILVTRGGLEPPTKRLRVFCSTIELAGPLAEGRCFSLTARTRIISDLQRPINKNARTPVPRSHLISEELNDGIGEAGHPCEGCGGGVGQGRPHDKTVEDERRRTLESAKRPDLARVGGEGVAITRK